MGTAPKPRLQPDPRTYPYLCSVRGTSSPPLGTSISNQETPFFCHPSPPRCCCRGPSKALSAFLHLSSHQFLLITEAKCVHVSSVVNQTLCNPMEHSPPGSSVHGIPQARILGVDCHALLQGIFLTQGSNPHLLHWKVDSLPREPSGYEKKF